MNFFVKPFVSGTLVGVSLNGIYLLSCKAMYLLFSQFNIKWSGSAASVGGKGTSSVLFLQR